MTSYRAAIVSFTVALGAAASLPPPALARPPGSGIAFTWPTQGGAADEDHPAIKVRQCFLVWADIKPQQNQPYVWTDLNSDISAAVANGQKIMLQVNAGPPQWVFKNVACVGQSRGQDAPQFWDPDYIAYYRDMISDLAAYIRGLPSQQRGTIIGVRVQNNAFNTEIADWDELTAEDDIVLVNDTSGNGNKTGKRSTWTGNTNPGAVPYGPDCDDIISSSGLTHTESYLRNIIQHFHDEFTTGMQIKTALRVKGLTKYVSASWLDGRFSFGNTMALDTGGESQVLWGGTYPRDRYDLMKLRCRNPGDPGTTLGYWEDFKESTTNVSGHTPANGNANQEFYWRQLAKLDTGACYGGVYGLDFEEFLLNKAGYVQGIQFFNKYAGYVNDATGSPGAWIAFLDVPASGTSPARTKLGFFLSHLNAADAGVTDHQDVGVGVNYEGMYSRRFGNSGVAKFSILPGFASQLSSGYTIKVTWYSPTTASWNLHVRNAAGTLVQVGSTVTGGTGGWNTKTFSNVTAIPDGGGTTTSPDFKITNVSGNAYFHLIEILK